MNIQTLFLILSFVGAILSAAGALGYAKYSSISAAAEKMELQAKLDKFEPLLTRIRSRFFVQ